VGECFFWYRPTRVVPDQRPLNGRCCCYFCVQDVLCKSELELLNLLNMNIYVVRNIIQIVCDVTAPSPMTVSAQ